MICQMPRREGGLFSNLVGQTHTSFTHCQQLLLHPNDFTFIYINDFYKIKQKASYDLESFPSQCIENHTEDEGRSPPPRFTHYQMVGAALQLVPPPAAPELSWPRGCWKRKPSCLVSTRPNVRADSVQYFLESILLAPLLAFALRHR